VYLSYSPISTTALRGAGMHEGPSSSLGSSSSLGDRLPGVSMISKRSYCLDSKDSRGGGGRPIPNGLRRG
jgi:hypothetical protein